MQNLRPLAQVCDLRLGGPLPPRRCPFPKLTLLLHLSCKDAHHAYGLQQVAGGQVVKAFDCTLQGCWFESQHAVGDILS